MEDLKWVLGEINSVRSNIDEFSGEGFVTQTMKDFAKVALLDLENRIKERAAPITTNT